MILKEDKSRSRLKWEHQSRKVKTRRVIKKKIMNSLLNGEMEAEGSQNSSQKK